MSDSHRPEPTGLLNCKALAEAHAAFNLSRAHAALLEMQGATENLIVYGALFSTACTQYASAFETQYKDNFKYTPSPKGANKYDKKIHEFLLTFRRKLSAHHANDFLNRRILIVSARGKDGEGNEVDQFLVPIVTQTTVVAPVDAALMFSIVEHVGSIAHHFIERCRTSLREIYNLQTWPEREAEMEFSAGVSGTATSEPSDEVGKSIVRLSVPSAAFRTPPPLFGLSAEHFLRLTMQLVGHDGTMEHALRVSFEAFPLEDTPSA